MSETLVRNQAVPQRECAVEYPSDSDRERRIGRPFREAADTFVSAQAENSAPETGLEACLLFAPSSDEAVRVSIPRRAIRRAFSGRAYTALTRDKACARLSCPFRVSYALAGRVAEEVRVPGVGTQD